MLAIFDFDQTLLSANTFQVWREHHPCHYRAIARSQPVEWWVDQFGGIGRVQQLKTMLHQLAALGVRASICTNNRTVVVATALRNVGLDVYFTDARGLFRICDGQDGPSLGLVKTGDVNKKGLRVKMMLERENVWAGHALFIDDSMELCDDVHHSNALIATLHCQPIGLQPADMRVIVRHFVALAMRSNALGLSISTYVERTGRR